LPALLSEKALKPGFFAVLLTFWAFSKLDPRGFIGGSIAWE
jgi:hypothetical protein